MVRRGILLAGGANTRLLPMTKATPKSLLPVFDRPLIYYPLSLLFAAGAREILLIAAPRGISAHKRLLGDGSAFGARIVYAAQKKPRGIADAFLIGRDFLGGKPSALALADNIFFGGKTCAVLRKAAAGKGAQVLAKRVPDPERFGVVTFGKSGKALSLVEKPKQPESDWAVAGCYFYDADVCAIAKNLQPSARGELEITDINREYLRRGKLHINKLPADSLWFDAGTAECLLQAANTLRDASDPSGLGCPEIAARKQGWLSQSELLQSAKAQKSSLYGKRLLALAQKN